MKELILLMIIIGCNAPSKDLSYENQLDSCIKLLNTQIALGRFYINEYKKHENSEDLHKADSFLLEARKTKTFADSLYKKLHDEEVRSELGDSVPVVDSSVSDYNKFNF
jgi:hypothetical protein